MNNDVEVSEQQLLKLRILLRNRRGYGLPFDAANELISLIDRELQRRREKDAAKVEATHSDIDVLLMLAKAAESISFVSRVPLVLEQWSIAKWLLDLRKQHDELQPMHDDAVIPAAPADVADDTRAAREDLAYCEGAKAYRSMIDIRSVKDLLTPSSHTEYDLTRADRWLRDGCGGRKHRARAAMKRALTTPQPPSSPPSQAEGVTRG